MNIARNALFNLAGGALPAFVSLATIPFIVRGLGEIEYGLFTLIIAIVGYFALIDVNVTAGSVKFIAEYSAKSDQARLNQTFSFGLVIYLAIGLIGGFALYFSAPYLIRKIFEIPSSMFGLGEQSLRVAAFGFLFGQLQIYLNSVPQSLLRYDLTSRLEICFGLIVPISTVVALVFGYGLYEVIVIRVIASAINCMVLWRTIFSLLPNLSLVFPERHIASVLVNFSAFSFLSRIAALSYAHGDKLIIGALIGMKELAYYSVAATLANRVLSLMFRLSGVMFPAASALAARGEIERLKAIYLKANRYVVFLNGSVLILVAVFAEPILFYWMNPEFARAGSTILAIVALAQFVDSLTNIPSLVNDGLGRPKITGLFAITRAVVGLAAVYILVGTLGIEGAAWAHFLSALLITLLFLIYVHGRSIPCSLRELLCTSYATAFAVLSGVAGITIVFVITTGQQVLVQIAAILGSTTLLCILGLRFVVLPEDRNTLQGRLRKFKSKIG